MFKPQTVAAAAAFACLGLAFPAQAACTGPTAGPSLNQTQLTALLTGNTVCAMRSTDRWQELHVSGGDLIDFKRGPGHAVDPSESVGRWSIVGTGGNATVLYNYGGSGGTFTFQVFAVSGNAYSFCAAGAAELPVTVKPGGGACP